MRFYSLHAASLRILHSIRSFLYRNDFGCLFDLIWTYTVIKFYHPGMIEKYSPADKSDYRSHQH
ncbi:hypothetical protein [Bacteroides sp.]|uniref:hypothetical protein n=1 Tax=Bacteroides sp. TaxID=29523 RepID=UPI002FC5B356